MFQHKEVPKSHSTVGVDTFSSGKVYFTIKNMERWVLDPKRERQHLDST